jgi:hypothetical protein
MSDKYAVNRRIKAIMKELGEPKVDPFYKKYWGKDAVSERLRTIVANETGVKTDFIVEFTEKIADADGKKINGHWLLTGEGAMFLDEKSTYVKIPTDNKEKMITPNSDVTKHLIETGEYYLLPKEVLRDYKIVPNQILDGHDKVVESKDKEISKNEISIARHEKYIKELEDAQLKMTDKVNSLNAQIEDLKNQLKSKGE